jgi:hypothetical protein
MGECPRGKGNDVVAAERALGRAHMECDAEHDRVKAIQQDYWDRLGYVPLWSVIGVP